MERDFVGMEQREINGKPYTLLHRTQKDPDFYCLMGRFFGSRAIAKALGMPIYDDEHRHWVIVVNNTHETPVACGSLEMKPDSTITALKSTWVEPDERGQGLYDWMFSTRLRLAEQMGATKITSTTTDMSKHTHERYGFRFVGNRGKYSVYWKHLNEKAEKA